MVDVGKIGSIGLVERVRGGRVAASANQPHVNRAADAASISTVAALVGTGPPIDVTRVAVIRAGIADGSYVVDAQATAAKMIENDLPPR